MRLVEPRTYLVGITGVDRDGLISYLRDTGQEEFLDSVTQAGSTIAPAELLVSFFAKLCYKSLVLGKNANISRVRDIPDNIRSTISQGHGSVFEHVAMNFVVTNCSRVFTHELVRHRVGTAFSQTSGRFVALDEIDLVWDPLLEPARDIVEAIVPQLEAALRRMRERLIQPDTPFALKKKLTSAIRRLAPNGQTNEIGVTLNLRALRHTIELRTSRHAEYEIRVVFNQIAQIVQARWPLLFSGAQVELVDGLNEYTNLRI